MSAALSFFTVCFPSLFSIVDPIASVPVYLALVGKEAAGDRRRTALRATLTLAVVLTLFAAGGTMIFRFFGITIAAFKVAGGVLLFFMAMDMLRAKQSDARTTAEERTEATSKEDVAIIPIGIPLLSGPGAIATCMVWSARAQGAEQKLALYVSIGLVAAITLLVLVFASGFARVMGRTGINIASRIMGLILAATAAQFILDGWREALVSG